MLLSRKIVLLISLLSLVAIAGSGFAINFLVQEKPSKQKSERLKLEYGGRQLVEDENYVPPVITPVVISSNRLLIPVGDTLYMLNENNQVVWEYSVEPNIIFDVAIDTQGMIYMAVSDGLLVELNASGEKIWGHFMNGSANYMQVRSYNNGLLTVVSMEGYRAKGSNSEDLLEFWRDKKVVWRKEFPRGAKLNIWGNKILAMKQIKEGQEITEIR